MRDLAATEGADVVCPDDGPRLENDPGAELFAEPVVGNADHLDVADRRMAIEELLDLARRDVLARSRV